MVVRKCSKHTARNLPCVVGDDFFVAAFVKFGLSSGRAPSSAQICKCWRGDDFFRRSIGRDCVEIRSSSELSTNLQVLAWRRFFSSQHGVEPKSSSGQILVWRRFFSSQHRSSSGRARSSAQICKCWRGDDFFRRSTGRALTSSVELGARSSAQICKCWRGDDFFRRSGRAGVEPNLQVERGDDFFRRSIGRARQTSTAFLKLKSSFGLMHAIRTAAHFPGTVSARACTAQHHRVRL